MDDFLLYNYICDKHGTYSSCEKPVNLLGSVFNPPCPICCKERIAKDEAEQKAESSRTETAMFEKLRIREEFRNKTLDNYNAETDSQKQALQACKDLINGKIKKVILMGGNGLGKSHLGNSVLKELGGIRYTAYELSCLYRQCYSYNSKMSEMDLINELAHYPFMFIDEVGRTKGSEAEQNFFSAVIDELHTRGKKLMLVTNKIRKQDCPKKIIVTCAGNV